MEQGRREDHLDADSLDGDTTGSHPEDPLDGDLDHQDDTMDTSGDYLDDDLADNPLDDHGDSPQWNDDFAVEPDSEDILGDPDSVAQSSSDASDVFDNNHSIPTYTGDNDFEPFSVDDIDSGSPAGPANKRTREGGFSGWIIFLILAIVISLVLAGWAALSFNTKEVNPVEAWKKATNNTTTVTEKVDNNIKEDGDDKDTPTGGAPGSPGANAADEERIKDLEESLTQAMDDVDKAHEENSSLQSSIDSGATNTRTVTSAGKTTTVTNTRTNTRTTTKTSTRNNNRTVTRTLTSRAPAPRPQTVTRTHTARVPGPERTVTKTVPSGRVTVTTTVVERWG